MPCQATTLFLVSTMVYAQESVPAVDARIAVTPAAPSRDRKPARPLTEALGVSLPEDAGSPERKAANPQPVISTAADAVVITEEQPGGEDSIDAGVETRFVDWRSAITSPRPGATLASPQRFDWTASAGAQGYWLWVGSCQDCTDLFDSSIGNRRSETVNLPTDGRRIYVTLFTFFDGEWWWYDYQYDAPRSTGQRSTFTQPTAGATLSSPQQFAWTRGVNVTEYWLWVGSCQDCIDLYDASQGTQLSRSLAIPTDGRVIYVTLFSLINGNWYWMDYQFRAPSAAGPIVTFIVTNKLVYAINLSVNGRSLGSVPAGERRQASTSGDNLALAWELVRPQLSGRSLGDAMSGSFAAIARPSGTYEYTVDNVVGSSHYFVPNVSNRTGIGRLAEVNGGLQSQNRCNCVVPAHTENVRFGYFRLFSNGNLRLYGSDSNYTGRYQYWSEFADRVEAANGLYRVVTTTVP